MLIEVTHVGMDGVSVLMHVVLIIGHVMGLTCVDSMRLIEALLSIDGVFPLVNVVILGVEPAYTLLVANWAEEVAKYLRATNSVNDI